MSKSLPENNGGHLKKDKQNGCTQIIEGMTAIELQNKGLKCLRDAKNDDQRPSDIVAKYSEAANYYLLAYSKYMPLSSKPNGVEQENKMKALSCLKLSCESAWRAITKTFEGLRTPEELRRKDLEKVLNFHSMFSQLGTGTTYRDDCFKKVTELLASYQKSSLVSACLANLYLYRSPKLLRKYVVQSEANLNCLKDYPIQKEEAIEEAVNVRNEMSNRLIVANKQLEIANFTNKKTPEEKKTGKKNIVQNVMLKSNLYEYIENNLALIHCYQAAEKLSSQSNRDKYKERKLHYNNLAKESWDRILEELKNQAEHTTQEDYKLAIMAYRCFECYPSKESLQKIEKVFDFIKVNNPFINRVKAKLRSYMPNQDVAQPKKDANKIFSTTSLMELDKQELWIERLYGYIKEFGMDESERQWVLEIVEKFDNNSLKWEIIENLNLADGNQVEAYNAFKKQVTNCVKEVNDNYKKVSKVAFKNNAQPWQKSYNQLLVVEKIEKLVQKVFQSGKHYAFAKNYEWCFEQLEGVSVKESLDLYYAKYIFKEFSQDFVGIIEWGNKFLEEYSGEIKKLETHKKILAAQQARSTFFRDEIQLAQIMAAKSTIERRMNAIAEHKNFVINGLINSQAERLSNTKDASSAQNIVGLVTDIIKKTNLENCTPDIIFFRKIAEANFMVRQIVQSQLLKNNKSSQVDLIKKARNLFDTAYKSYSAACKIYDLSTGQKYIEKYQANDRVIYHDLFIEAMCRLIELVDAEEAVKICEDVIKNLSSLGDLLNDSGDIKAKMLYRLGRVNFLLYNLCDVAANKLETETEEVYQKKKLAAFKKSQECFKEAANLKHILAEISQISLQIRNLAAPKKSTSKIQDVKLSNAIATISKFNIMRLRGQIDKVWLKHASEYLHDIFGNLDVYQPIGLSKSVDKERVMQACTIEIIAMETNYSTFKILKEMARVPNNQNIMGKKNSNQLSLAERWQEDFLVVREYLKKQKFEVAAKMLGLLHGHYCETLSGENDLDKRQEFLDAYKVMRQCYLSVCFEYLSGKIDVPETPLIQLKQVEIKNTLPLLFSEPKDRSINQQIEAMTYELLLNKGSNIAALAEKCKSISDQLGKEKQDHAKNNDIANAAFNLYRAIYQNKFFFMEKGFIDRSGLNDLSCNLVNIVKCSASGKKSAELLFQASDSLFDLGLYNQSLQFFYYIKGAINLPKSPLRKGIYLGVLRGEVVRYLTMAQPVSDQVRRSCVNKVDSLLKESEYLEDPDFRFWQIVMYIESSYDLNKAIEVFESWQGQMGQFIQKHKTTHETINIYRAAVSCEELASHFYKKSLEIVDKNPDFAQSCNGAAVKAIELMRKVGDEPIEAASMLLETFYDYEISYDWHRQFCADLGGEECISGNENGAELLDGIKLLIKSEQVNDDTLYDAYLKILVRENEQGQIVGKHFTDSVFSRRLALLDMKTKGVGDPKANFVYQNLLRVVAAIAKCGEPPLSGTETVCGKVAKDWIKTFDNVSCYFPVVVDTQTALLVGLYNHAREQIPKKVSAQAFNNLKATLERCFFHFDIDAEITQAEQIKEQKSAIKKTSFCDDPLFKLAQVSRMIKKSEGLKEELVKTINAAWRATQTNQNDDYRPELLKKYWQQLVDCIICQGEKKTQILFEAMLSMANKRHGIENFEIAEFLSSILMDDVLDGEGHYTAKIVNLRSRLKNRTIGTDEDVGKLTKELDGVKLEPRTIDELTKFAKALKEMGKKELALTCLDRAIVTADELPLSEAAKLFFDLKEYGQAISTFKQAIEEAKAAKTNSKLDLAGAHYNLALSCQRYKDDRQSQEAINHFKFAHELGHNCAAMCLAMQYLEAVRGAKDVQEKRSAFETSTQWIEKIPDLTDEQNSSQVKQVCEALIRSLAYTANYNIDFAKEAKKRAETYKSYMSQKAWDENWKDVKLERTIDEQFGQLLKEKDADTVQSTLAALKQKIKSTLAKEQIEFLWQIRNVQEDTKIKDQCESIIVEGIAATDFVNDRRGLEFARLCYQNKKYEKAQVLFTSAKDLTTTDYRDWVTCRIESGDLHYKQQYNVIEPFIDYVCDSPEREEQKSNSIVDQYYIVLLNHYRANYLSDNADGTPLASLFEKVIKVLPDANITVDANWLNTQIGKLEEQFFLRKELPTTPKKLKLLADKTARLVNTLKEQDIDVFVKAKWCNRLGEVRFKQGEAAKALESYTQSANWLKDKNVTRLTEQQAKIASEASYYTFILATKERNIGDLRYLYQKAKDSLQYTNEGQKKEFYIKAMSVFDKSDADKALWFESCLALAKLDYQAAELKFVTRCKTMLKADQVAQVTLWMQRWEGLENRINNGNYLSLYVEHGEKLILEDLQQLQARRKITNQSNNTTNPYTLNVDQSYVRINKNIKSLVAKRSNPSDNTCDELLKLADALIVDLKYHCNPVNANNAIKVQCKMSLNRVLKAAKQNQSLYYQFEILKRHIKLCEDKLIVTDSGVKGYKINLINLTQEFAKVNDRNVISELQQSVLNLLVETIDIEIKITCFELLHNLGYIPARFEGAMFAWEFEEYGKAKALLEQSSRLVEHLEEKGSYSVEDKAAMLKKANALAEKYQDEFKEHVENKSLVVKKRLSANQLRGICCQHAVDLDYYNLALNLDLDSVANDNDTSKANENLSENKVNGILHGTEAEALKERFVFEL